MRFLSPYSTGEGFCYHLYILSPLTLEPLPNFQTLSAQRTHKGKDEKLKIEGENQTKPTNFRVFFDAFCVFS